ncbi:MAG: cobalamin biosynthesis protein CbiX [Actinomycetota bacterium]|nr:cobalamin biosynthesis protein CbiX [Actinomycetota bacterium]
MADPPAVLLVNHGSRQPHAAAFAEELSASLRRDVPNRIVAVSYLELNRPSPAEALRKLAIEGTTDVQVVPLLFSAGYHYRIDIPAAIDAVLASAPDLRVRIARPLLSDSADDLIGALEARLHQAMDFAPNGAGRRPDGLVLLAAGSSDQSARARVAGLADAWSLARGHPVEVAFCDLRGDEVRVAIALLEARGARRIACGSLFLAAGRLLEAGQRSALQAGALVVAGPLGLTPALTDLIRRRCLEPLAAG